MKKTILSVEQLKKKYGDRSILNGLSFHVKEGEIVGLLGSNGAGKTTAFYAVMGLIRPDSGHVFFQGSEITSLAIDARARLGMGYLAQEPSVFRQLTVKDNILCILETLPLSKKEREARLHDLLGELHLEKLANEKASSLSGGERRRLEITRALVRKPTFLLLDEPFANIDPISVHDLKELIRLLAKKNIGILITDHNAREIFSIVDRSYLIQDGQVLLSGTVSELVNNEQAKQSYFGSDFKL